MLISSEQMLVRDLVRGMTAERSAGIDLPCLTMHTLIATVGKAGPRSVPSQAFTGANEDPVDPRKPGSRGPLTA